MALSYSASAPTSPISQCSSIQSAPRHYRKSFDISVLEEAALNEEKEIEQETNKQQTLDDLINQVEYIDIYIKGYKDERRRLMDQIVHLQYTKDQIIGLTQSNLVKTIENSEVTISYGHICFESYYTLPNFKLLIKAKIPLTHPFLQDHDIETSREHRNWPLLTEFVTFELFD